MRNTICDTTLIATNELLPSWRLTSQLVTKQLCWRLTSQLVTKQLSYNT